MTRHDQPVVPRPLACKLGFHALVSLESVRKSMSRFQRLFVVRRIDGCRRCGAVYCTRLNNPVGGGGRFRSGYVDPAEIEAESPAGAN